MWRGIEFWSELTADAISEIRLDLFGLFVQYLIAKATSIISPWIAAITEGIKFAIQAIDLFIWSATDKIGQLASGIVNIIMAVVALKIDLAGKFVLAVCRLLVDSASKILTSVFETLLDMVAKAIMMQRSWIDWVEIIGDVALGLLAFAKYGGYI